MGKFTISMVIFHSYVKLPEGKGCLEKITTPHHGSGLNHPGSRGTDTEIDLEDLESNPATEVVGPWFSADLTKLQVELYFRHLKDQAARVSKWALILKKRGPVSCVILQIERLECFKSGTIQWLQWDISTSQIGEVPKVIAPATRQTFFLGS